jgi:hypothetical protein
MPHDELRNAVREICARLEAEVDAQLGRMAAEFDERVRVEQDRLNKEKDAALNDLRRETDARIAAETENAAAAVSRAVEESARLAAQTAMAAEAEWTARLDTARQDAEQRAARASDERLAAETLRWREELEQAVASATGALRQQLERGTAETEAGVRNEMAQALAAERERAANELEAERARHQAELTSERDRRSEELEGERRTARTLSAEIEEMRTAAAELVLARNTIAMLTESQAKLTDERDAARQAATALEQARDAAAVTTARAEERDGQLAFVERMLGAIRTLDSARSLSDTMTALTTAAATMAPRVAVFVVHGEAIQGWRAAGFGDPSPATLRMRREDGGVLATALDSAVTVSTSVGPAPAFAALPADRAGLAVPALVGGHAVAVLYADDAGSGEPEAPASWPEALQILVAHASARLSHITALRTSQAIQAAGKGAARARGDAARSEEENSARRYARLLVSEIKLYNESAVRLGREKRDLRHRLRPEIERARRLFEERVPQTAGTPAVYFEEELVHTLADGDAALLGSA